jgi:hypothetical protein
MIPVADIDRHPALPSDASFRLPSRDEISEEGFGFFRDVWYLGQPGVRVTGALIEREATILERVDRLASDEDEFESIARAIELGDPELIPGHLAAEAIAELDDYVDPEVSPLEGLELGVAGLSYALSTVGLPTAASCRGHDGGWAAHPVVFFAAQRLRAEVLERLVSGTRCGFIIDPARSQLLVLEAPSVADTVELAQAVLSNRKELAAARVPRPRRPPS